MTHHMTFSMAALHYQNAKQLLNTLEKRPLDGTDINFDYSTYMTNTLKKSVLIAYSINSCFELIVNQLIIDLNIEIRKKPLNNIFHRKLDKINDFITIDTSILDSLKTLRKLIRNKTTHWGADETKLLGSLGYFYAASNYPSIEEPNELEQLLYNSTSEKMNKHFADLTSFISAINNDESFLNTKTQLISKHILEDYDSCLFELGIENNSQ